MAKDNKQPGEPKASNPSIGVGETCVWFRGNDKRLINAGIVVRTDGNGVLDIALVPVNGGPWQVSIKGVYHHTHEQLQENPRYAANLGSWATVGEAESMRIKEGERIRKLADAREESAENRQAETARKLQAEGMNLEEVARRLDISKEKAVSLLA